MYPSCSINACQFFGAVAVADVNLFAAAPFEFLAFEFDAVEFGYALINLAFEAGDVFDERGGFVSRRAEDLR
ncbi:MAG: hypothetical protein ACRD9R_15320 [Pyrinomonadaceae bacterium]